MGIRTVGRLSEVEPPIIGPMINPSPVRVRLFEKVAASMKMTREGPFPQSRKKRRLGQAVVVDQQEKTSPRFSQSRVSRMGHAGFTGLQETNGREFRRKRLVGLSESVDHDQDFHGEIPAGGPARVETGPQGLRARRRNDDADQRLTRMLHRNRHPSWKELSFDSPIRS